VQVENLLGQALPCLDRGEAERQNVNTRKAEQSYGAEREPPAHDSGGLRQRAGHSSTTAGKIIMHSVTNTTS
jgi:hypothetical protein